MADQTPQDPQDDQQPATPEPSADAQTPEEPAAPEAPAAEQPEAPAPPDAPAPVEAEAPAPPAAEEELEEEEPTPRVKPAIPGADLEVDIVVEGEDRGRAWSEDEDPDSEEGGQALSDEDEVDQEPIAAQIQLAEDARYRATGKRKTAIARVILKPGTGQYTINGRTMDDFFPRATLQRTIRQPLEAVGYEDRMDVVARLHGGGVSAAAGALRHGISRALLEADPNLRTELKRRGFLTRDARAKERKKAGLKKARKKPQFSKR
ncbi:30S ribosomal protein S9 [Baekduia soli]|uniref:Small ribosomal subunit protein uS9 n=1 Tax=Baekduia soli TaxID=496014 RepID=A0A5B8UAU7_9ACTN|nr:30S ribosomal protein S9 [Baekduia soli]